MKQKSKAVTVAKVTVTLAITACLAGNLGLGIYQTGQSSIQNRKVSKFIENQLERQAREEEQKNTYQEDGYKVGNEYEIRSTTHISDAYKNKNDSGLDESDKETLKKADEILSKIIKKEMSAYEKELAVYEWMYKNISQGSGHIISMPGSNSNAYVPHDVLEGKSAVCVGYATTFRMFMHMLGIRCHVVHNEYHSWDLVELEPDQWYHVDIYSDVSTGNKFKNFNMTDAIARLSNEWDDSALPQASAVKYSSAVQNAVQVKDIYQAPTKIKKALDNKESSVYYKFQEPVTEKELAVADFLVEQLNDVLSARQGYENYSISGSWYPDEKDQYILGLFIVNYEESGNVPSINADSKEGKKISEALKKAFAADTEPTEKDTSDTSDTLEDTVKNT